MASLSLLVVLFHVCASLRPPPWLAKYNAALDAKIEGGISASVIQPELAEESSNPSKHSMRTSTRRRLQNQRATTTRRTESKLTYVSERWDSESDAALLPGLVYEQPQSNTSAEVSRSEAPDSNDGLRPTTPERAAVWLASTYDRLLRSSKQQ